MDKRMPNANVGEDLNAVIRTNPANVPDRELERVGFFGQVMQATPRHFSRLPISDATLIIVRAGRKMATSGPLHVSGGAGEIVAIAAGEAIDLINYGPTDAEPYRADCFGFDDNLVREVAATLPDSCTRAGLFAFTPPEGFEASAAAARAALDPAANVPPEIIRHRLAELLVWVAREGCFFTQRREPTMFARVRTLVCTDLTRDWTASEISARLGLSEATLRRRLRAGGSSLTEAIGDARMSIGLAILQTSAMPVSQVALEVGYSSASKFASRFRARFGLSPSEIRRIRS